MKAIRFFVLCLSTLFVYFTEMTAQDNKEVVVVMKHNYTYEDPRWGEPVEIVKGEAITVIPSSKSTYQYWPYPAADVEIPKKVTRLPGEAGEQYIVLNGTNIRFREGPSTNYGYYCINTQSSASVYHNQFIKNPSAVKTDNWGLTAEWEPYYLPKGTRLPYLGKKNGFYKTKLDGIVFYVSAKFCLLK